MFVLSSVWPVMIKINKNHIKNTSTVDLTIMEAIKDKIVKTHIPAVNKRLMCAIVLCFQLNTSGLFQ